MVSLKFKMLLNKNRVEAGIRWKTLAKRKHFGEEKMQSELLNVLVNVQIVQQLAKFSSFILTGTKVTALLSSPRFFSSPS